MNVPCDVCSLSTGKDAFICTVCKYCVHPKCDVISVMKQDSVCKRCSRIVKKNVPPKQKTSSSIGKKKDTRETKVSSLSSHHTNQQHQKNRLPILAAKPHKMARVGSEYQCVTPKWIGKEDIKSWDGGSCKMMWCPSRLPSDKVDAYLKRLDSSQQDYALQNLHESNYNVTNALKRAPRKRKHVEAWKEWTTEDKKTFNTAMSGLNDKYFNIIKREHMPHKSIGDLVQYYYGNWKFTKARQIWRDSCTKRKDYHDDVCFACEVGGDLICCDTCHLAFHLDCAEPKINESDLTRDLPWSCKFCVFELKTKAKRVKFAKKVKHISQKLDEAKAWTANKMLGIIN